MKTYNRYSFFCISLTIAMTLNASAAFLPEDSDQASVRSEEAIELEELEKLGNAIKEYNEASSRLRLASPSSTPVSRVVHLESKSSQEEGHKRKSTHNRQQPLNNMSSNQAAKIRKRKSFMINEENEKLKEWIKNNPQFHYEPKKIKHR